MTAAPNTVPIVSVVGKGDSGKTTFLEKLIRELADRGVRVATVKHHIHDYDIDVPGKDSYRHARAGAFATMVSSPEKFALIHDVEEEMSLDTIARIAHDAGADLLITEGYKHEGRNRIEISRRERSDTPHLHPRRDDRARRPTTTTSPPRSSPRAPRSSTWTTASWAWPT